MNARDQVVLALLMLVGAAASATAAAQVPNSIAAPGETVVLKFTPRARRSTNAKPALMVSSSGSFANPLLRSSLMAKRSVATMPVQAGSWPTAARLSVRSLVTHPAPAQATFCG